MTYRINRRSVLLGGAALAGFSTFNIGTRRAHAAEFSYKWGNNLPVQHPMAIRSEAAAKAILEESGGRLEISVFPANQLGADPEMLNQIRDGSLEIWNSPSPVLSSFIPVVGLDGMGFAWKSYADVWPAVDGEFGAYMRKHISERGLIPMEKMWDAGFRQISTSEKPITKASDLEGVKLRVPVSPLWTSMFQSLGAATTTVNFNEVYTALQTKLVDGMESSLSLYLSAKLYEVQKYCCMTNHVWTGQWTLVNGEAWTRLPEDLQEIAAKHINEAAIGEREDVAKIEHSARADLESKGMVFAEADLESFRSKLAQAGFYKTWREKYGEEAWAILESKAGKLG